VIAGELVAVLILPHVLLATLVCVGPAARDFNYNDEVPLGERIEYYPPFTDSAAKCAA
jgi:hypothetical protein